MAGSSQLPDEAAALPLQPLGGWRCGPSDHRETSWCTRRALTGPGRGSCSNDRRAGLDPFTRWAAAGKAGGAAMWMQISHPGRQVLARMPGVAWGPSAVAVELGKHSKRFRPAPWQ